VVQQDTIGWVQSVCGRLAKKWEDAQEKWIFSLSTKDNTGLTVLQRGHKDNLQGGWDGVSSGRTGH
jgi:hypothetical protein